MSWTDSSISITEFESKITAINYGLKLKAEKSLASFVKQAWPLLEPGTELAWNWHLDTICGYLEAYYKREIKRLIINVPPGTAKSILVSVLGPAWAWVHWPDRRFINLTNEIGLATRDNLRMRQIVTSDWYQGYWGDRVQMAADQKEKLLFLNTKTGFRQGLGITGNVTGKRGTDLIIDDPLDAQKAFSDVEAQKVNDTYDQAVSSRLNDLDRDGICLIMQRLRTNDLTGHLLKKEKQHWTHLVIPMEYEGQQLYDAGNDIDRPELNDPRTELGELMFPQRFPRHVVETQKEDWGSYGWAGQAQQRPSPLGGGILKAHWWKQWPEKKPLPICDHIFMSWDTAFSEEGLKNNSYSAYTQWGVFWDEQKQRYSLLLLDAWDERVDYPELRQKAMDVQKEVGPDRHLIEKKASGQSLLQDLKRAGISVYPYNPDRDKVSRAYAVQAMLENGQIWYVPSKDWARRVVDMCSQFPRGAPPSSDLTDTACQAWLYLRNGWWLSGHDDDPKDEDDEYQNEPQLRFYG